MKKLVLLTTLVTMFTVAVSASDKIKKDDDLKISYSAKRNFESEFRNAEDVVWTTGDTFQKASFTVEGKKTTAFYDMRGDFLGATQFVKYAELPAEARKQIESEYKGFVASEVLQVVSRPSESDQNDVGTYWVDLKSDKKQVFIKIASNVDIQLVKQTTLAKQ